MSLLETHVSQSLFDRAYLRCERPQALADPRMYRARGIGNGLQRGRRCGFLAG